LNFQLREFIPSLSWLLTALCITAAIGSPIFEVLFMNTHFGNMHFSIPDLIGFRNWSTALPPGNSALPLYFTQLWLGLGLLCVVIHFTVTTASYFQSKKALSENTFNRYFYTPALSNKFLLLPSPQKDNNAQWQKKPVKALILTRQTSFYSYTNGASR
jgi:hypothetical protein